MAIENGFDINSIAANFSTILQSEFQLNEPNDFSVHVGAFINNSYIIPNKTIRHWESYSLNDLVLQTNFFECLFKGWSLYTQDYGDTLIELRADYIDVNGTLNIGEDSLELSCHKNTVVQFKKIQWVLEVEKGTALEWLFNQFRI